MIGYGILAAIVIWDIILDGRRFAIQYGGCVAVAVVLAVSGLASGIFAFAAAIVIGFLIIPRALPFLEDWPPTAYSSCACRSFVLPCKARKVWRQKVTCPKREVLWSSLKSASGEVQFWCELEQRMRDGTLKEIEIHTGNKEIELIAVLSGHFGRSLLLLHWMDRPPGRGSRKRRKVRIPHLNPRGLLEGLGARQ